MNRGSVHRTSVMVNGTQIEVSLHRQHDYKQQGNEKSGANSTTTSSSTASSTINTITSGEHKARVGDNVNKFVSNIKRKTLLPERHVDR